MFHMTNLSDDRVRDLGRTAAELRHGRPDRHLQDAGPRVAIRVRIGAALVAAGTMLVSSARPAASNRA